MNSAQIGVNIVPLADLGGVWFSLSFGTSGSFFSSSTDGFCFPKTALNPLNGPGFFGLPSLVCSVREGLLGLESFRRPRLVSSALFWTAPSVPGSFLVLETSMGCPFDAVVTIRLVLASRCLVGDCDFFVGDTSDLSTTPADRLR